MLTKIMFVATMMVPQLSVDAPEEVKTSEAVIITIDSKNSNYMVLDPVDLKVKERKGPEDKRYLIFSSGKKAGKIVFAIAYVGENDKVHFKRHTIIVKDDEVDPVEPPPLTSIGKFKVDFKSVLNSMDRSGKSQKEVVSTALSKISERFKSLGDNELSLKDADVIIRFALKDIQGTRARQAWNPMGALVSKYLLDNDAKTVKDYIPVLDAIVEVCND